MRHISRLAGSPFGRVRGRDGAARPRSRESSGGDRPRRSQGGRRGSQDRGHPGDPRRGNRPQGEGHRDRLRDQEHGGSDLVISDARPGCGCTVASFDKVIKPGAEGKVQTSVDTKSFSGPISKSVLVVSNDPDRPQMNLFVKALVKPFVDVAQQYVRFSVVKGDSASQDVVLISEEKGFKPAVAETAQPYVKAEISPAGDKDKIAGRRASSTSWRLRPPDAPEGL